MRLRWLVLIVAICSGTVQAWQGRQGRVPSAGTPAEGRAVLRLRVGLDANPKADTKYEDDDFSDAIRLMRSTGANHYHLATVWASIERRAGTYDVDEVRSRVEHAAPLPVAFNLRVLDAGARSMPEEYKALAWDSPAMVDHISATVAQLAPILRTRAWSYAIGNEIDMYFDAHPGEIAAYGRMLEQVKGRVKALHPGVLFTASFQFTAAARLRTVYAPIVNALDHVAFTYYPLGANFAVRPPSAVVDDLQIMIAAARPRPVFLQEIGYPSATILGGSPEQQRDFVRLAFEAMRAAGTSQVLGGTYLFQADLPEWLVKDLTTVYGNQSEPFRAYLTTLGLRDERDRPKPGWDEFVRQAHLTGPWR